MTYDQELAAKGKMRTQVLELVRTEDGRVLRIYREKIIKMPKVTKSVVVKPKVKRARVVKGNTKLDQARKLFASHAGLGRLEMITLFMDKLQMTKAGASTYYYNAQL